MTAAKLWEPQIECLEAIESALLHHGTTRQLAKMPTGTGKTVMFTELLERPKIVRWREQFPKKGAHALIIAHREELLDQAAAKIRARYSGLMVDIEQGERRASRYSDVIVASIQTLSARKYARLEHLMRWHQFRIVIVDEAHHAAAASYRTVLARLGFLPKADESDSGEIEAATQDDVAEMTRALQGWDAVAPKDRLLIGVTATPNRTDAIGLGCVFQSLVYNFELKTAIERGFLVPIVPWVIETAESLDDVRITHGEFNQKDLGATVNTPRRNELAVESWQLHAGDRSTIAFSVDVQHAHDLAATFQAKGIRASALSGETPKEERRDMLASFSKGGLQVLCNCMVLTEGTDLPRTGCILHAKPTKSATLYEQMTGRGLRTFPGKADCIVIDMVDIARKHSLQTAPSLFGLPPGLITKGQNAAALERQISELAEKYPGLLDQLEGRRFTMQELLDRASTFDVWKIQPTFALGHGRAMNWIKTAEDYFRLSYPWADGTEELAISRNLLGQWQVVCTLRPFGVSGQPRPVSRQRTLADSVPTADAAAGLAEAFILQERRSVAKLKAPDAAWRTGTATPKQIASPRARRAPPSACAPPRAVPPRPSRRRRFRRVIPLPSPTPSRACAIQYLTTPEIRALRMLKRRSRFQRPDLDPASQSTGTLRAIA